MLGISGLVVERFTIQVAYRTAKAFLATGSMEWMHQTEGVLIFGACNANLGAEFQIFAWLSLLYVLVDLGDAQCDEATMKILNNVT